MLRLIIKEGHMKSYNYNTLRGLSENTKLLFLKKCYFGKTKRLVAIRIFFLTQSLIGLCMPKTISTL